MNYIAGRMFWATGFNEAIEKGNQASEAYSKLIHTRNSVWNLPWDNGKGRNKNKLIRSRRRLFEAQTRLSSRAVKTRVTAMRSSRIANPKE